MKQQFNLGDVVQLKSGGPAMTINSIELMEVGYESACIWFSRGKIISHTFFQEVLEKYEKSDYEQFFIN